MSAAACECGGTPVITARPPECAGRVLRRHSGTPWAACGLRAAAALLFPLTGCVNMSGLGGDSKYACAAPEGVACDSVSGTYGNALHNNLPSQRALSSSLHGPKSSSASAAGKPPDTTSPATPAPPRLPIPGGLQSSVDPSADARSVSALRSQARVLRLWTKPWEDADGDLWDQGYVYVQVDAGRWQIDHVQQRIRDGYAPLRPPPAAATGTDPAPSLRTASTEAEHASEVSSGDSLQRPKPAPFNPFPSLSRPPAVLGSRPQ